MLAERFKIGDRPQRAPDQALDFQRPSALLAARCLAVGAGVGGAWQHAVLGGDPAATGVAKKGGNPILDRGRAQHMGVAEFCKARSFGMQGETLLECDVAKCAWRAAGRTLHENSPAGMS